MLSRLIRLVSWFERFLVAARNLGTISAFRLLVIARLRVFPKGSSIPIRALHRTFYYRGACDLGVMSHFFSPGYRVRDFPGVPVQYIIDAGANIGDETVRFRHFHKEALIIALEPEPDNFRMLCLNVSKDPRIFPLQTGLWPRDGRLRIQPGTTNESFRVEEVSGAPCDNDVQAISIPSLINKFGIPHIDILKLDIEGAEYYVFDETCKDWVSKVKVFIFECPDNDHPGAAFRIFGAIGGHPFKCFLQGENIVLIRQDVPWLLETTLFIDD